MDNLISVRGVTKRYGGTTALDNVSIDVPSGCITGFIGANGAGKTTAIRAIMGLATLDAGSVILFGEPFDSASGNETARRIKSRIGVVFDTCPFVNEITVKSISAIMRATFPSWKQDLFESYLSRFELDRKKRVKSLSRGMGMKLQIACALAHEPDLLIMDEATAGLDPMARDEMLDILREYLAENEDRAIFLSSHITSDLEKIADRIVCIDAGRIAFDMEKDEITDMAGVAKCRASEFEQVAQSGFMEPGTLRHLRHGYGIDLLVPDRFAFARRFPEIACDRAGIDDYMQLTLKGEIR